jgi:hypothetical protein
MMKTIALLLTLATVLAPCFASDNPDPEAVWATVRPLLNMMWGLKCLNVSYIRSRPALT